MQEQQQDVGSAHARQAEALRVLIVDDHQTFAELLQMALDSQPDITCVGHVQDASRVVEEVARLQPDVCLVDVHLGEVNGLDLASELVRARPGLRVIMLTASSDAANIARAASAGACGYLPKAGALTEVLAAVRSARPGGLVLHPGLVLDLVALERRGTPQGDRRPGPDFTGREQQVLELLAQGLDVAAIARRLGIRPSTCRGYVQNVLAKLDVHTQLEAVVQATTRGLVQVGGGVRASGSRRVGA